MATKILFETPYRTVYEMTCEEWSKVQTNPRQRDTERRLNHALSYLSTPKPSHYTVMAASTPSGRITKLDGHTRGMAWDLGLIPKPEYPLIVVCYHCNNMEEVKDLYDTHDTKEAVEKAPDVLTGTFREYHFVPKSNFLSAGKGMTPIKLAQSIALGDRGNSNRGKDFLRTAMVEWREELEAIDEILVNATVGTSSIHSGIFAAMLITLRKRGQAAYDFWEKFFDLDFRNSQRVSTPQLRLLDKFEEMKNKKLTAGQANTTKIVGFALSACENYIKGNSIANLRQMRVVGYYRHPNK